MLQQTLERPEAETTRPAGGIRGSGAGRTVSNGHLRSIATVALAPFVVLFLRATHASWTATGDYSLIEMRTRDVGTSSTPLVGPYSRFGWNHPGPALFYAFAAPYRAFASHGTGLLAGATIVGALSTIAIVVVFIRRSPTLLVGAFGLLLFASLVRTLGAGFLWDPWNPYVIVLPFFAFVCFAWWAATGEERALPVAIGIGSFVVQTHVSLGLEFGALMALALGWLMLTTRDTEAQRRLRHAKRASVAVVAVMWMPPIVQEFLPGGGNIGELLRFWTQHHRDSVGFARAARLIAPEFTLPAPWLAHTDRIVPASGALAAPHFAFPFALVALAIATVLAWRRRDRFALATCSIAVTAAVGGWITFSRIVGVPYPYLVVWSHVIGPLCWFAAAVVLLPRLAGRLRPATITWMTRAVAATAVVLLVLVTAGSFTTASPDPLDNHAASTLFASVLPELRRLPAPLIVASKFGYSSNAIMGGLIASSVEHGIDARYSSHVRIMAGDDHVVSLRSARTYIYVVINQDVAAYSHDDRWRQIGLYDSLSPTERAELNRLDAALQRATAHGDLTAYTAGHARAINQLKTLERRALLAGVFVRRSAA
jgi:hypothetical protein